VVGTTGTVFELSPGQNGWTETILYSFTGSINGPDGDVPIGGVVMDKQGKLYGATESGGEYGNGSVYMLAPFTKGYKEVIIHSFNGADGGQPSAGLTIGPGNQLYGTTSFGGTAPECPFCGVIFSLSRQADGTWTETVLHAMLGSDGYLPVGPVVFDEKGNLYAASQSGGINAGGSVFMLTPTASGEWNETVLHLFDFKFPDGKDGQQPYAGVSYGKGKIVGTTASGGIYDKGIVFEATPPADDSINQPDHSTHWTQKHGVRENRAGGLASLIAKAATVRVPRFFAHFAKGGYHEHISLGRIPKHKIVRCEKESYDQQARLPMKSFRVSIALYLLLLTILLLAAGCRTREIAQMYPATPETQSAFLKNYTPVNVLNRFNNGQAFYSNGGGDTAGYESVKHTADFEGDFALCSEKFMPLMDALSDDVAAQLVANGAHIISQIGVAQAGFHFDYKLGKTSGSVTIAPLQLTPDLVSQKNPRPKCMVDVQTRIDVAEKWFPKGPGLTQVSVNNSIR
jgi:hypothetical protein